MSQTFAGTVVSLKNLQTAAVEMISADLYPKYRVPRKLKKKIQAHYTQITLQLGDKVVIKSSRPYSRTKRFLVVEKLS
jgi:small subunit ribosomal protein S17